MGKSEMTSKIYKNMMDIASEIGQLPVKWQDRVLEYVREKEGERVKGMMCV